MNHQMLKEILEELKVITEMAYKQSLWVSTDKEKYYAKKIELWNKLDKLKNDFEDMIKERI